MSLFFFLFPDGRFVPRWTRSLAVLVAALQIPLTFLPNATLAGERGGISCFRCCFWGSGSAVCSRRSIVTGMSPTRFRDSKPSGSVRNGGGHHGNSRSRATGRGLSFAGELGLTLHPDGRRRRGCPATLHPAIDSRRHPHVTVSWDIDLIINRTLVYAALTASVVGLYVLVVGLPRPRCFRTEDNLFVSLVATGVVAVLFQPAA